MYSIVSNLSLAVRVHDTSDVGILPIDENHHLVVLEVRTLAVLLAEIVIDRI